MNPNVRHKTSIFEMLSSILRYQDLIIQMTKREVIGRYRGSMFGLVWSFFNPLIMLIVYTLVFSAVFNAKWGSASESKIDFALALFIGMIVHSVFAECFNRAPRLMINNVSFVKKVVFPLEVLPWVVMGSTLFHTIISLCVWVLFYILVNHSVQWTVIFVPFIFAPLVFFVMGLSWFFASLGVYLRDVEQFTGVISTILLFMSPVFYPVSQLPPSYQTIVYLNPLTFLIEQSRDVLMWGIEPNWAGLFIAYIVSILVAWLGFVWFQKTRQGVADVV